MSGVSSGGVAGRRGWVNENGFHSQHRSLGYSTLTHSPACCLQYHPLSQATVVLDTVLQNIGVQNDSL